MLNPPATLDRGGILRRIPHQGTMCLLDAVLEWDAQGIRCETRSHLDATHPLRAHGRLGAACGVEYAAQAMAVHGALMGETQAEPQAHPQAGQLAKPPRAGFLAGVRSVRLQVERLDTVAGPLTVRAQRITGDDNTVLYSFSLDGDGQALLSGRALVVLDAARLAA